jgi:hypothetical protein
MNDSTRTPIPFGPHHDSVQDPRLCLGIPAAGLTLVYCPRHACGCLYNEATGRWMIQTPVDAVDFLKALEAPGLELPDDAAEAWLTSVHRVERELEGGRSH